jgi:hypothetical protein
LIASIKESRPPAARRRDQLRRPDRAICRSARPCNDAHAAWAEILLEHRAFSRQVVPFRLTQSRISVPSPPQRRPGVQVTFFDPGGPSDFPELRGAVRPHDFDALFPVRYLGSLLRWAGQCMGAVGEPRKRPHCLMCFGYGGDQNFEITNALFRECWTRTYESQRHRHAYRWGWHHVKAKSCH